MLIINNISLVYKWEEHVWKTIQFPNNKQQCQQWGNQR